MEYITPTEWKFDIGQLQNDVSCLLQNISFGTLCDQISLTSRPNAEAPLYDGIGSLWDSEKECYIAKNSEFTEFNDVFKGTYLEYIYDIIHAEVPLGRVRLMRVKPFKCYSLHTDSDFRYHLAIQTNEASFIMYRDAVPIHIPADGVVYKMDATHPHTALNGDRLRRDRIHLVFSRA